MEEEKDYLTVPEVKEDLGIGRNIAYRIFARDDFPAILLGRKYTVNKKAYEDWKQSRRTKI